MWGECGAVTLALWIEIWKLGLACQLFVILGGGGIFIFNFPGFVLSKKNEKKMEEREAYGQLRTLEDVRKCIVLVLLLWRGRHWWWGRAGTAYRIGRRFGAGG